jgi:hypothetical protein
MALGLTQPPTEMSTRNISWGVKAASANHIHVPIVLKSGSLNLLEPSGPVQDCNGIALPFFLSFCRTVLLKKLTGLQPVKQFPAFYGTQ